MTGVLKALERAGPLIAAAPDELSLYAGAQSARSQVEAFSMLFLSVIPSAKGCQQSHFGRIKELCTELRAYDS